MDLIELSHVISPGLVTYPGLPGPVIRAHLSREDSRGHYAEGTEFEIGAVEMVGNTGTYLDTPFHRYPEGSDLSSVPLAAVAHVPIVVVSVTHRAITAEDVAEFDVRDKAVLLHTGWDRHFGTPDYGIGAPYLSESGAHALVEGGAALVGIDSVNIDECEGPGARPAHTTLLAAGIYIVEHLRNIGSIPARSAYLHAAPPLFAGLGTLPVRAYALVP